MAISLSNMLTYITRLSHEDMVCKQPCTKQVEACAKGHTCVMMCYQRCVCPCPNSELLQHPVLIGDRGTGASAVRRMITHGLGVARQGGASHSTPPPQGQAYGNPMAYRPKTTARQGIQRLAHPPSQGPLLAPGPQNLRESYPYTFHPVMSTAQGRQIGPPMVTHYDQHTRLPLTPTTAAVVASGTTPPPSSAPMNRVHQAPQPIVEVVTENQENG